LNGLEVKSILIWKCFDGNRLSGKHQNRTEFDLTAQKAESKKLSEGENMGFKMLANKDGEF
jgi:hypothetical protein